MLNNTFKILNDLKVPSEELGKNWTIFEVIAIVVAILPWLILIIYLLFLKKYRIRYFVDGKLINEIHYKKNNKIDNFEYQGISKWYIDEECTIEFKQNTINENIKLYGKNE